MQGKIKAVVFDLFGTLTDGKANAERSIIEEFSINLDEKKLGYIICSKLYKETYYDEILTELGIEATQENKERIKKAFMNDVKSEKLREEVKDLLKYIKKEGLMLGLISSLPCPIYDFLKKENIKDMFDKILYSYELGIMKPNPKIFQMMLSSLKIKPEEMLWIGNSYESDFLPAKKLGIKSLLIDVKDDHKSVRERISNLNEVKNYF